jgi:trehalose 6-phosphate synthase
MDRVDFAAPVGVHSARERQWSAGDLRRWIASAFQGRSLVVLANRQPMRHDRTVDGRIVATRSSGGLVTALEPLIEACAGSWVAHGAGSADADVVDALDCVGVPPHRPAYRLKRVWLTPQEERGYYRGFSNEGLWPLCHRAHVRPVFRAGDFAMYREVNERFADAVCAEVEDEAPVVLVQDYHFALAPRLIRQRLPLATIVAFWHIPFPDPRTLAICPWAQQLLDGLLGSTVAGFQTADDRQNFVDAATQHLPARYSNDAVTFQGAQTHVGAYPISVEWPNWTTNTDIDACRADVRARLNLAPDTLLGVGVDRLDYTKGITEKFLAVERLLESYEEFRGRFVLVQVAEPSRESLPAYQEARARIVATAARVNARFRDGNYTPILLLHQRHEPHEVQDLYRAADLCYVGSLHDGMNLVAKEFVAARHDLRGVLVLSEFAGASKELHAAVVVNPYATHACAAALARGLTMAGAEQESRMRTLRGIVRRSNIYAWAAGLLSDAAVSTKRSDRKYPRKERKERFITKTAGTVRPRLVCASERFLR